MTRKMAAMLKQCVFVVLVVFAASTSLRNRHFGAFATTGTGGPPGPGPGPGPGRSPGGTAGTPGPSTPSASSSSSFTLHATTSGHSSTSPSPEAASWAVRNPLIQVNNQRTVPAIKIDPSGKVYQTQILKQQLANELDLSLRDLRIVDPTLPHQIQATFRSRRKAILFSIENIKVVVQKNEALVFNPHQAEVQELVPVLQQLLSSVHPSRPSMSQQKPAAPSSSSTLRFEHAVIEASLSVVCSNLLRQVRELTPNVESTLKGLRAESRGLDVVQTQVDELLPLKNQLDDLRKRVKELKRSITELLNNDEDLEMMSLSSSQGNKNKINAPGGKMFELDKRAADLGLKVNGDAAVSSSAQREGAVETEDDQRSATLVLEMLFENCLNEVEWIASEIEEVVDEITNTEEYVVLQLDLLRNRILKFELMLSVASFVVTCGALVTGLFGMNLLSHFETNRATFYIVSAVLGIGMTAIFKSLTRYAKREKLF